MSVGVKTFNNAEVQILSVSSTSSYATFATHAGITARDLRIINNGAAGAWVLPVENPATVAKNIAGGVAGTAASYVLPGEDIVISKCPNLGGCAYIAAITDSSTTQLMLHAGKGS